MCHDRSRPSEHGHHRTIRVEDRYTNAGTSAQCFVRGPTETGTTSSLMYRQAAVRVGGQARTWTMAMAVVAGSSAGAATTRQAAVM